METNKITINIKLSAEKTFSLMLEATASALDLKNAAFS